MPDSLNSGNMPGGENKTSLSNPQAKSPLEEANEKSNFEAVSQSPVAPPVPEANKATPLDGGVDEPQTTPAPDTDEFLKSILDSPPKQEPVPDEPIPPIPPTPPAPLTPPAPSVLPGPIENEIALEEEVDRGDLLKNQSNLEEEPQFKPKIKDEIGGMDGIVAGQDRGTDLNQPPASNTPQNGESQTVSSDFLASEKNKPASGGSNKLLYVVVVIAILAIGGYTVYSMFFSKSKTTPTVTTSSPVVSATVSSQSADQKRKNDLYIIQQALFSYYTNNGSKYPIAPEIVFLNSPGNALENALVPDYLGSLPADPDVAKNYAYKSVDGTKFELTAILDDSTDSEALVKDGKPILTVTQDSTAPLSSSAESEAVVSSSSTAQDTAEIDASPVF